MTESIPLTEATKLLQVLVGKQVLCRVSYANVLLLDVGQLTPENRTTPAGKKWSINWGEVSSTIEGEWFLLKDNALVATSDAERAVLKPIFDSWQDVEVASATVSEQDGLSLELSNGYGIQTKNLKSGDVSRWHVWFRDESYSLSDSSLPGQCLLSRQAPAGMDGR